MLVVSLAVTRKGNVRLMTNIEKDLDNISTAILDLLQLVTYEAVRAHTFRCEFYSEMIEKNNGKPQEKRYRDLYIKEKEYTTVLEYMGIAFREMQERETDND